MLDFQNTATRVAVMSELIQPHILIVDDDADIRALLTEYFAENGLRVSSAGSGSEMSKILEEAAIDLVVMDLRLGGEDGMAIARKLRSESVIPLIMLTGVRDEADRVMGLELGADDYLTKPFSPRELLARVRTVLRRAKAATPTQAREAELRAPACGQRRPADRAHDRRIQPARGAGGRLAAGADAGSAHRGEPGVRQRSL